jgi:molybdopterin-containing oxidoreductase family iron-sulfur binding subunit
MKQDDRNRSGAAWRSLDELADTPEFRAVPGGGAAAREFPGYENVFDHGGGAEGVPVDRRRFLQLMGASLALMGLGGISGCRRPDTRILPYSRSAGEIVPGMPLYYATSIPRPEGCYPVLVESHEGRPTKVEGNPRHPLSRGASDLKAQASVLDLYDPDRLRDVRHRDQPSSWQDFDAFATAHFATLLSSGGRGLRFLSEEVPSPAMQRLREHLAQTAPEAVWHTYEPLNRDAVRAGAALAFGEPLVASYHLDRADVVLALDADFLGDDAEAVRHSREFGRRRSGRSGANMNRLYVVENTFTITGGMADHRLAIPAAAVPGYLLALSQRVLELLRLEPAAVGGLDLRSAADRCRLAVPPPWIEEVAKDLVAHRGGSAVLAGRRQPALVHALTHLLNHVLGNHGRAVVFGRAAEQTAGLADLTAAIGRREVQTLVVLGGNPAVDAPADLDFGTLLGEVPHTIRLALHEDETAALCEWRLPAAHYLETWGDAESADGTYSPVQPLIAPLFGGRSALELVARLIRYETTQPYEIVLRSFRQRVGAAANQAAFRRFLHEGFWPDSARETVRPAPTWGALAAAVAAYRPGPEVGADNLELSFHADYRLGDGRFANNGWLQETPDPITRLTWDNAACVSPETARRLGVRTGDLVALSAGDRTVPEIAVYVLPGQADHSISIHLGHGRPRPGRVGQGHGFNVYPLRTMEASWAAPGVGVRKLDRRYALATTQEHDRMEGRDLIRVRNVGTETPAEPERQRIPLDLAPRAHLDGEHQWGMAVDLSACTGCSACVAACQSENNIPIVGKDEVLRHRAMHWIRLDRYFIGDADAPTIAHQPVMCQHCESAPCEPVCPVNAPVHSPEGLNLQVYNRCVGTRYCANNCPYKTRRFNWFDYHQRPLDALRLGPLAEHGMADTLQMQKNPDVTVRMRGVMEKCTFCVQRIERGKAGARLADPHSAGPWPVPDGTIVPACAQACPAQAIVFGNVADPNSRVSQLKSASRNYRLLDELNTRPRVSYLARLRNPNPAMPAAEDRS